jgi:two-component system, LuxR family, response regulator FixJ
MVREGRQRGGGQTKRSDQSEPTSPILLLQSLVTRALCGSKVGSCGVGDVRHDQERVLEAARFGHGRPVREPEGYVRRSEIPPGEGAMSSPPVLVYIVEDNPEHRTLLHDIVELSGYRVRGFVSSEEFLAVYDHRSPGIIILDLRLPGIGGASLVEELVRKGCWWPVIILTAHPNAGEVERARKAGAVSILRKPIKGPKVLAALEEARRQLAIASVGKPNPGMQARFAALKPGELAVLDGMREGLKTKQIADRCAVTDRTVRLRLQRILEKTGAESREHVLQLAVTAGMPVKPPA